MSCLHETNFYVLRYIFCCVNAFTSRKRVSCKQGIKHSYFFSSKKDTIIRVNNDIPGTNLSVKLDMHFFTPSPRKFKYNFAVAWLIPKEKPRYCVPNFHLVWNKSRYERLYVCLCLLMSFYGFIV